MPTWDEMYQRAEADRNELRRAAERKVVVERNEPRIAQARALAVQIAASPDLTDFGLDDWTDYGLFRGFGYVDIDRTGHFGLPDFVRWWSKDKNLMKRVAAQIRWKIAHFSGAHLERIQCPRMHYVHGRPDGYRSNRVQVDFNIT